MKVFLLIFIIFTPIIAKRMYSNVYFKLIGERKDSVDSVIYKLHIKENKEFLEFFDENFEVFLIDSFLNGTNEHISRTFKFFHKKSPTSKEFEAENLIQDDKLRTVFKFCFRRFLYKLGKFCDTSFKCVAKITIVNFKLLDGWNSRDMIKTEKIYSQIDAYLTLCAKLHDEHLESCENGMKVDFDANRYVLVLVLLMVFTMSFIVIIVELCIIYFNYKN